MKPAVALLALLMVGCGGDHDCYDAVIAADVGAAAGGPDQTRSLEPRREYERWS